jgi:diacylglycerol kinase family enzyme
MAICLNSNPYTYLGNIPLNLAPDADLDRGLVMATFRSIQFATLLGLVASVLRRGSHFRRHRTVDYRPDLAEATVYGHGPFPYQVDGDYLGEAERLAFRHEPDTLTVVVP